jgi:hypothetical protein
LSRSTVSNSSPLIYLARLNKLALLRSLFGEIFIPRSVYNEVVLVGKQKGFLDARGIERAIEERWIKVGEFEPKGELLRFAELDSGEADVLSLALELHATLVLIDDASARLIAEALGLNSRGTIYVLLRAASEGIVTKAEVRRLLAELIATGFRISSEIFARILNELE